MTTTPQEEDPLDLGGVPGEEDVSEADAAERVDLDPDEQVNYTDQPGHEVGEPPR